MHRKEILTLLLTFGVDPLLHFCPLAGTAPSKDNLQSKQTTMHEHYFST
jgi:hypothetical protein